MLQKFPFYITKAPVLRYKSAHTYGSLYLSQTFAMGYSVVTTENLAGTPSPISLYLLLVTLGGTINSQLLLKGLQ